MKQRQNSTVVSDAISSQEIARSGSSNAAGALERVTGASIVEGRHVFVRGLGGRYANTRLNGSVLPSPDPDKQSLPMDLIPTSVLDNIVIEKSFAPNRPGDFAGGSIDLNITAIPEPSTGLLLALGLMALAVRRCRSIQ